MIFPNYGRCVIIRATGRRSGKAGTEFPQQISTATDSGQQLQEVFLKKRNNNGERKEHQSAQ